MLVYADYRFYEEEYFGQKVPRREFTRLAARASRWLDQMARGRIDGTYAASVSVRMACCAMADALWDDERRQAEREVQSESLDGYAVRYERRAEAPLGARLTEAARTYLWSSGLMCLAVAYA